MKLELQDAKGLTGVFIEVPLEQLKEGLGFLSSSPETEAQLKESQDKVAEAEVQLKQSQDKIAELEDKVATVVELEEKLATAEGRTMGDFTPIEKANFVIAWAKDLSMEDKAIFCEGAGIPIAKVTEAEVAEAAAKRAAGEAVEDPAVIQGKTDRPGYKFLEYLNMSVKE